jgi:hypothetical protein
LLPQLTYYFDFILPCWVFSFHKLPKEYTRIWTINNCFRTYLPKKRKNGFVRGKIKRNTKKFAQQNGIVDITIEVAWRVTNYLSHEHNRVYSTARYSFFYVEGLRMNYLFGQSRICYYFITWSFIISFYRNHYSWISNAWASFF